MKKFFTVCVTLLLGISQLSASSALTLKDVSGGKFSAKVIGAVTPLSGDTYARISSDRKQIVECAFKSGKQLRVLFDVGTTVGEKVSEFDNFSMSPDGTKMLIQTNTKRIYRRSFTAVYYIYDIASRHMTKLSDYGPQQTPIWSPDGNQIAFVRDNNIFLVKLLYDNAESAVTKDGKFNEVINGIPDWVNEEEFAFNSAMAFNADGTMICWIRYDETKVPVYSLQMFKGSFPANDQYATYPGEYSYKYPKAGEVNSTVSVHSYDIKSRKTLQLQVPLPNEGYIPRIKATSDANRMIVYTMNRHQSELCLYAVNPKTTISKLLIKETNAKYIKEEAMEGIQFTPNHILLPSERDGYMQLYLYDMNGSKVRQITTGKHDVTAIYGYDEKTGCTYYQAAVTSPMNREVYVTNAKGKTTRLTDKDGWNSAIFSGDFRYFINQWSDRNTPTVYTSCNNRGDQLTVLEDNKELNNLIKDYNFPAKEFFSFTTSEGVQLNGVMIKPANFDASKRYPVIMWQYSGPGSQQVINSWNIGSMGQGGALDTYLTQQGFILVCVDGRGTGGRGGDFEKCTYLKIGDLESKDQVEAALYLGSLPYVDKDNIGIWGWSFGGFNTLMSMSEGRNVFKAGVSVAPPTDWRFYDTVYTERYMRTPKENPTGYDTNPMKRAAKLDGQLLICFGLADDNVHPQNIFEYTEALVQADKDFKMNVYTNRNHSIYGGNTRNHLFRQISDFFCSALKQK